MKQFGVHLHLFRFVGEVPLFANRPYADSLVALSYAHWLCGKSKPDFKKSSSSVQLEMPTDVKVRPVYRLFDSLIRFGLCSRAFAVID